MDSVITHYLFLTSPQSKLMRQYKHLRRVKWAWGKGQGERLLALVPGEAFNVLCVLSVFKFETGLVFKLKSADHLSICLMH